MFEFKASWKINFSTFTYKYDFLKFVVKISLSITLSKVMNLEAVFTILKDI